MKIRRIEFLVMFVAVLALNLLFSVWWLSGNAFTPAWASRLAQTGGVAGVNAIPQTFSYQGTLRNANGSVANGNFKIRLRIYDQPISGNTLHDETFDSVVVRDGLFTVVVGDAGTPLGATVFTNAQLSLSNTERIWVQPGRCSNHNGLPIVARRRMATSIWWGRPA